MYDDVDALPDYILVFEAEGMPPHPRLTYNEADGKWYLKSSMSGIGTKKQNTLQIDSMDAYTLILGYVQKWMETDKEAMFSHGPDVEDTWGIFYDCVGKEEDTRAGSDASFLKACCNALQDDGTYMEENF